MHSILLISLLRCVVFSSSIMSDSLWPHGLQHTKLLCPSQFPGACSNSHPLSRQCHPTISFSIIPVSSCLQSFPASGSFQMSQFFTSGSQSIGVSASASVPPMNIQDWFPLGLTSLILHQTSQCSLLRCNQSKLNPKFYLVSHGKSYKGLTPYKI